MSGQDFSDPMGPATVQTSGNAFLLDKLRPFCGDSWRVATGSPWWKDGKAIATDGRIIVSVPCERFADDATLRRPDVSCYLPEPTGLTWQPMPALPVCSECNGTGKITRTECEECEGTGEIEHDCDCEFCTKTEECDECDGEGKFTGEDAIDDCDQCRRQRIELIGDSGFSLDCLTKITSLGPAEIALDSKDKNMLRFRCGQFSGCLMALNKGDK